MTIKLSEDDSGIEINCGPSESHPGATSVTIFALTRDDVEEIIISLYAEYGEGTHFIDPQPMPDGKWGSYGRVP